MVNGYVLSSGYSITNLDAGIIPYVKGDVEGFVWNDLEIKEDKSTYYDGLFTKEDRETAGVEGIWVGIQYLYEEKASASNAIEDSASGKSGENASDEAEESTSNTGDRTTELVPDGTYLSLFTFDERYQVPEDLTEDADYFISGSYLIPLNRKAEDRFLEDAKAAREEVQSDKDKAKQAREQAEEILQQISQLTAKRDQLLAEESGLYEEIQSLSDKRQVLGASMAEVLGKQLELKNKVAQGKQDASSTTKARQQLIKDRNALVANQSGLPQALADKIQQLEEAKALLAAKQAEKDSKEQILADEYAKPAEDQDSSLIADLTSQLAALETGIGTCRADITQYTQEAEYLERAVNDLPGLLDELDQEIEELQSFITDTNEQVAKWNQELSACGASLNEIANQMEQIDRESAASKAKLPEVQTQIQDKKQEIALAEAQREEYLEKAKGYEESAKNTSLHLAGVETGKDGTYRFAGLPMFKEFMGADNEAAEPMKFRLYGKLEANSSLTTRDVQNNQKDTQDSDAGVLTEEDYLEMARYGIDRGELIVTDSFTLTTLSEEKVNAYDGRFRLRTGEEGK